MPCRGELVWFLRDVWDGAGQLEVCPSAKARARAEGHCDLAPTTRSFAQSLVVEAEGFAPKTPGSTLPPGGSRTVLVRKTTAERPVRGTVQALSCEARQKWSCSTEQS